METSRGKHVAMVQFLLGVGANANLQFKSETALTIAIMACSGNMTDSGVAAALLRTGADANFSGKRGAHHLFMQLTLKTQI